MPEPLVAATYCATLVDEWARLGLTDAVVCPGSRSTPMAVALAEDERVRVHVHLDERSGAFTALGLALAQRRPVLVLTTSGTAAVELHPAVVEASYAGVPLVALTADRPPELQGVGAPQTIDQRALFGSSVRACFDPGPPDQAEAGEWRGRARSVWFAATGAAGATGATAAVAGAVAGAVTDAVAAGAAGGTYAPGPVQLNLAFREPLLGEPGQLPPPLPELEADASGGVEDELAARLAEQVSGRRVLVVAGGGIEDPAGVVALAEVAGWPVLADPRSGCRRPAATTVAHADALLRHGAFADDPSVAPEVVLRLGRPWASKVLAQWLARCPVPQVLVEATGLPADPDGSTTERVVAEPGEMCRALLAAGPTPSPSEWLDAWVVAERAASAAVDDALAAHVELVEPGIARTLLDVLPDDAALVVSSSMPVRDVEWYGRPRTGLRVLSNRGANGIDGVTSTAVGVALAGGPTACLVGDVAFLHDTNGLLGASRRHLDLVVVVVHNDGGGIFSFLPPATALPPARYEQLFGTPHGVDLAALARVHGAQVAEVSRSADLEPAVELALAAGGLHVVVARTDRMANVGVHDAVHAAVAAALVGGSPRG